MQVAISSGSGRHATCNLSSQLLNIKSAQNSGYSLVPTNPGPLHAGGGSRDAVDSKGNGTASRQTGSFRLAARGQLEPERSHSYRLIHSIPFQLFSALLILSNAVIIGFETDLPHLQCWNEVEHCFLFAFTLELGLRIVVVTPGVYFSLENPELQWNIFDVCVVTLGLVDSSMTLVSGEHHGRAMGGATVFRIIRLLRILRVFRIVRFLKQLYMLAFGFAMAAEAVFWVTFLMMFVLYVSSVILVRTVGHTPLDEEHGEFLRRRFGTILRSMTTLFELMAVPDVEPYQEILIDRPFMAAFFVAYVIFGSFGMIALLTGVISEGMFEKNRARSEEERAEREATRKALGKKCADLFNDLALDDHGDAQMEEVATLLPQIGKLFEDKGIVFTSHDLEDMLVVIDTDGSGTISREEFRHFILAMSEGVTPISMLEIYYAVAVAKGKLEDLGNKAKSFQKCNMERLVELKTQVNALAAAQTAKEERKQPDEITSRLQRCEDALGELKGNVDGLRSDMRSLMSFLEEQALRKDTNGNSAKWSFGGRPKT